MYSENVNGYTVTGSRGSTGFVQEHGGMVLHSFTGDNARRAATDAARLLPECIVPEPEQPSQPAPVAVPPEPSKAPLQKAVKKAAAKRQAKPKRKGKKR